MTSIGEQELTDQEVGDLIDLIYKFTGMTIAGSKRSLLQGRIRPRIRTLGLQSFSQYIDLVRNNKDEVQNFINQITTNETSFFRTPRVWNYFKSVFLPQWSAENKGKKLKIWSGAASSGEEIYSIAIQCHEHSLLFKDFDFHILGTDISTKVLGVAKAAQYAGKSIESLQKLHPEILKKYFVSEGGEFRIQLNLTNKVEFLVHNLLEPHKKSFDIVFLRNVLIYFDRSEQERILSHVANTLSERGKLIIGESESLTGLKTPFRFVEPLVYEKELGS